MAYIVIVTPWRCISHVEQVEQPSLLELGPPGGVEGGHVGGGDALPGGADVGRGVGALVVGKVRLDKVRKRGKLIKFNPMLDRQ